MRKKDECMRQKTDICGRLRRQKISEVGNFRRKMLEKWQKWWKKAGQISQRGVEKVETGPRNKEKCKYCYRVKNGKRHHCREKRKEWKKV